MMKAHNRSNPLSYRSISQMDEHEAEELAARLNLPQDWKKPKPKEQNLIIRNGVLKKLEPNDLNFIPSETKIITDINSFRNMQEKIARREMEVEERSPSRKAPRKSSDNNPSLKRKASIIDDFEQEQAEDKNLKEDYCRLWFEKLAVEANFNALQRENQKKDELISQLRQQLQGRSIPHQNPHNYPVSQHGKSNSNHSSFTVQPQNGHPGNIHWNPVHPNRNFNISQPPFTRF